MKKTRLVIFFLAYSGFLLSLKAQINQLDSLKKVLKTCKSGMERLPVLVELSNQCDEADIIKYAGPAVKLGTNLLKEAKGETSSIKKAIADAANNMGFAYTNKGESDKALEYYNKSLVIRGEIKDKKGISECYINIGYILEHKGDIANALDHYQKAFDISEEIGDKNKMAYALNNMGFVYQKQDGLEKALEYYLKSMKLREEIGDKLGLSQSLTNIGAVYKMKKMYAKAIEMHLKSLAIQLKSNNKVGISNSYNNIGYIYECQKEYGKALDYYQKSLSIREEISEKRGIANTLNNIGRIYLINNNLSKALESGERAFQLSKELGYPENISNASDLMASLYKRQGKYKDALQMYELFLKMHDSINNEFIRKNTAKQEVKFEYAKRASVDSMKNAEERKIKDVQIASQELKIKQERINRWVLFLGLFLVIVFAGFMVSRYKISQKQKRIIELQKKDVELQRDIIEEKQKEIVSSINYAKRIQYTMLAHQEVLEDNISDHFILFQPKDIVSGDFYWAIKKNDLFYLAVCDSTGHGVPGAFMSLLNISFMNEAINEKNIVKPNEIFNYVRDRLITSVSADGARDGMDGILFCIDRKLKKITYAAAYNEPVVIRNTNEILTLGADKMPIGKGVKSNSFSLFEIDYQATDTIYLFTDGFSDQFGGPKGKKFKHKKLQELLLSITNESMDGQHQKLSEAFFNWKGNLEQVDDVLLIGIKV